MRTDPSDLAGRRTWRCSRSLPGVASADARGDAIVLRCTDSDLAIRVAARAVPVRIRDIEISGAGLEEAFLELTARRARRGGSLMNSITYVRFELIRMLQKPAVLHHARSVFHWSSIS